MLANPRESSKGPHRTIDKKTTNNRAIRSSAPAHNAAFPDGSEYGISVRDDRSMPPRKLATEPPPNPRLDPYRRGIARLWAGDQLAGYLATRVQVWWTVTGPFWRRRGVDPTEKVEWLLSYVRSDPRDHADGWDDGITNGVDAQIDEWDAGRFTLGHGEVVRVEWLEGPEASNIRAEYGWG